SAGRAGWAFPRCAESPRSSSRSRRRRTRRSALEAAPLGLVQDLLRAGRAGAAPLAQEAEAEEGIEQPRVLGQGARPARAGRLERRFPIPLVVEGPLRGSEELEHPAGLLLEDRLRVAEPLHEAAHVGRAADAFQDRLGDRQVQTDDLLGPALADL